MSIFKIQSITKTTQFVQPFPFNVSVVATLSPRSVETRYTNERWTKPLQLKPLKHENCIRRFQVKGGGRHHTKADLYLLIYSAKCVPLES